ncbi:MAG: DUF3387 domain-containing protein [Nostoc sp. ChiSLP02]|nr:DUF3387 domain-containing protein [Nostoc sp. DedSLP05]MDZ8101958.1 DUF3387 domain-containing protein [Nostoc sp. DedSLP01]MDZ8185057.1 DUF3387 domain-containing protein [Nostoc sp. ChiSLP02]
MEHFRWVSRVPDTLTAAKMLLENMSEEVFKDSAISGYWIAACCSEYGNVRQCWLVVESQAISQIDFEALKNKFASTDYQRTETEKLKTAIAQKLQQMVRLNKNRINYLDKFQQMIAEYNADSRNVQIFFNDLINFTQELRTEDKRAIAKNLVQY